MKKLILLLCLFPLSVFGSWTADVTLGIDGETFKSAQVKLLAAKETSITLGRYILKMTLKNATEEEGLDVTYILHEVKGKQQNLICKGVEVIEVASSPAEIFAKGEPKQPNTIITLKFNK
jgi:hypothetical protein